MGSGFDVDVPGEQIGIIPRAIEHLFGGIQRRIDKAHETGSLVPEFKVMAQFMELYNEEVIDLFNPVYNKVGTPAPISIDELSFQLLLRNNDCISISGKMLQNSRRPI